MFDKLLYLLLGRVAPKCYTKIDEEKRDAWLLSLVVSDGFQSYVKYRDLQILKTMANGVDTNNYWRLVGQRAELLYLIGESKRLYEREKKRSGNERDNKNDESV
jgi:hypothetical protein